MRRLSKENRNLINQLKAISILLAVLLAMTTGLNIYLYFGVIRPLQENASAGDGGVNGETGANGFKIFVAPYGRMGIMTVYVNTGPRLSLGQDFNISVQGALWDPYTSSGTYNLTIRVYERSLYGTYPPDSPTAEKNATVEKHDGIWGGFFVPFWINMTVTPPHAYGIYIYKTEFLVASKIYDDYSTEFPIIVTKE